MTGFRRSRTLTFSVMDLATNFTPNLVMNLVNHQIGWCICHHIWWWILWSTKFGDEFDDGISDNLGDEYGGSPNFVKNLVIVQRIERRSMLVAVIVCKQFCIFTVYFLCICIFVYLYICVFALENRSCLGHSHCLLKQLCMSAYNSAENLCCKKRRLDILPKSSLSIERQTFHLWNIYESLDLETVLYF